MRLITCLALVLVSTLASRTNTTKFFEQKLGYSMGFQTFSGYQDIDWSNPQDQAKMYYSFAQGRGKSLTDKTVPLIVYLEGGPGFSSQQGAFNHVGPLHIEGNSSNFTVVENGWSWNIYGHMVFIDQPLNVGFSYSKSKVEVNNSYDAAAHVINFLHNFLQEWDLKDNPLYISGISYAGHYIPVIARNIITDMSLGFNLKGIMIGGAYIDPESQLNFFDSSLYSVGIASEAARTTTASMQNQALVNLLNKKYPQAGRYSDWVLEDKIREKFFGGVDLDNYKSYGDPNINLHFGEFLQANKKQFGVPDSIHYVWYNPKIFEEFMNSGDYAKSMGDQIDFILNRGLRTMIFNGQNDMNVNTAGVLTFLNTIQWHDLTHWQRSPKESWKMVNTNAGWVKKWSNLVFVLLRDAGHLSPADQPRAALTMVNNFIHGIW